MGTSSTPPVVRDDASRDPGPDLSRIGTDLVIADGEVMTYAEYRRRDVDARERTTTVDRRETTLVVER
ncbi:hypothetical protein [Halolamina sp. C58]|uniref:hypothetical protein n=1 Tax=Halolamina sp. C58 TaxID=3421640 RepID=UPI003EB98897